MNASCVLHTTTFRNGKKAGDTRRLAFMPDPGVENQAVNLYPGVEYQAFEGFGAAFTDSAGYVYAQMDEQNQKQLLDACYGPGGLRYTLGRVHLDSCDFSLGHYQALEDKDDREMAGFTLARSEEYLLPLLRDAQQAAGRPLPLLAAPWSPPAFMKSNGERNHGGVLLEPYRDFYAEYLCRYVVEMRKAGAHIVCLTTQNEPLAVQQWDSCIYTARQEKEFLLHHLRPALQKYGLEDLGLYIWDHNKERVFERVCEVLDEETANLVEGIAFHWYSGDHFEALELVRSRFPGKKLVQSEACIEYRHFSPGDFLANAQKYAHDIIGSLNAGMTAFYDWNLLLDGQGGPNHVGNYCDAPFLYHAATGELEERASYAYIRHFSHYIQPGARRIASSRYADEVEVTAFRNPDGGLVAVLLNRTERELPVYLRLQGELTEFALPPASISTAEILPAR